MDHFDLENPLANDSPPSSLFLIESDHAYFHTLYSTHSLISLRTQVISFISQLSCTFDPLLSYLSINYLDRFLANHGISQPKPWILRLLAVSCFSLAAKMMKTEFSISDIQGDGSGVIFEMRTIQRMEALILGALQWRMRSITPFSFIPFFIAFFTLKDPTFRQVLKNRATELIFKSQKEIRLLEFKPSIIAASALLSASHELFPFQYPCFLNAISDCEYVNKESILKCNDVIQDIAMEGYESIFDLASSSETPMNVLDLDFLSSESEKTNGEKGIKRRKISGYGSSSSNNNNNNNNNNNHRLQISQIEQC